MKKIIACALFFVVAVNFAGAKTITPKKLEKIKSCFAHLENGVRKTDDCYFIHDAEELYGFAAMVNGDEGFEKDSLAIGYIVNDIVVNEKVLNEDGSLVEDAEDLVPWIPLKNFSGCLYFSYTDTVTISGLYFKDPEADNVGLIGNFVDSDAFMTGVRGNVILRDSYFEGRSNVGSIFGYVDSEYLVANTATYSTVKGVNNVGGIVGNVEKIYLIGSFYGRVVCDSNCGGFVGYGDTIEINSAHNYGTVECSNGNCGGLAGSAVRMVVKQSENFGNVEGGNGNSGGIVGYANDSLIVHESLNEGNVSGMVAGGICGFSDNATFEIVDVYNMGSVKGSEYAAGIVGKIDGDKSIVNENIFTSFNHGSVSGDDVVDVIANDNSDNLTAGYVFYVGEMESKFGVAIDSDDLKNGNLAMRFLSIDYRGLDDLNKQTKFFVYDCTWGQDVKKDLHPVFSGKLVNKNFSINFVTNEGVLSDGCKKSYLSGYKVALPAEVFPDDSVAECNITREGFAFMGWCLDEELEYCGFSFIYDGEFDDKTYYAKWSDEMYSITYEVDGEVYMVFDSLLYNTPHTIIDEPPEKEGHYFSGWSTDEDFRMQERDVTITGRFYKRSYTAYFVADTSGWRWDYYDKQYDIVYGDTIAPLDTILEREYYTFVGWTLDGENKYDFSSPIKGNTYLYALWTLTEDSVLVDVDGKTMWVKVYLKDNASAIDLKIKEAVKANPEMTPPETYSDGKYECTFTGDWKFVGGNVYKPVYSKTPIILEETVLMNGVKQKVFIKATYSEADVQSLISAAAFSNLDMRFKKTYYDDEYEYTFVKWVKNDSGYYVPSYSKTAREVQKGGEQDSSKQDVAKQDSTKNSESKQDSTKKDSDKDSKKDTKKDSKKDAIPALPVEFASLEVHGMGLAITGLANYSTVTVHDMLGHAVAFAHAVNGACGIQLPHAGSYIVRIGKRGYKVSVK